MKPRPMFVYGTLRPGAYNAWYEADRIDRDCTAEGRIYFVHGRGGYPVAKLDEEGTILGDLIWLDPQSEDYQSICRMEIGAGYEIRKILVTTREGEIHRADAWHYKWEPRGELIKSGDWRKESGSWA